MTDTEVLAIRKGLAEAQGWRRDALEPKPGWRPLWPYRRGQERKTDWPDPFTEEKDFVQLLAWALRQDVPALMRAVTLAIWINVQKDEMTKGEEKP